MVSTAAILARHRRGELSASMALAAMLVAERVTSRRAAGARRCRGERSAPPARSARRRHCPGSCAILRHARPRQPCGMGSSSVRAPLRRGRGLSPAASVALYSLGDEALLAAATDEVVGLLDRLGILGPDRHLLDLGCGIGRFEQALSPVAGVSHRHRPLAGMIEAARARCAGLPNVRHHLTSGRDLGHSRRAASMPSSRSTRSPTSTRPAVPSSSGRSCGRSLASCGRRATS